MNTPREKRPDTEEMKRWAMKCIQRALVSNMDQLWAKATQNPPLVPLPFLSLSFPFFCLIQNIEGKSASEFPCGWPLRSYNRLKRN